MSTVAFTPPDRSITPDPKYRRTLRFAFSVAAELEGLAATGPGDGPRRGLRGGHAVGDGYYYEMAGSDPEVTAAEVEKLHTRLRTLIDSDAKICAVTKPWKDAVSYFESHGQPCAKSLLETRVTATVSCHECQGVLRLGLHPLLESFGALASRPFSLVKTGAGLVLCYADTYKPQSALIGSFRDHATFGASHEIRSVGDLNTLRQVGRGRQDFALCCELRQDAKIAAIVAECQDRHSKHASVKVICIAGPTASGKTTFATKLCLSLRNVGFAARPLTVDHYYLPLDRQPRYQARNQRSDVDYDHIESMDVDLVGEHLNALAAGKGVMTPVYNMKTGYRDEPGHFFDPLPENGILVIEGIHAMNPLYTKTVEASKVFKVFISPLTALQIDDWNVVKSTDHRLLRRMSRDALFRGNSASVTLKMWDNVRQGEGLWIYPHQNDADFVMNSAAEYEIPILKTYVEPLLRAVTPDEPCYAKAEELLSFLDRFGTWPPALAPPSALLREFIGDGSFDLH